jgi:hypothetical protein
MRSPKNATVELSRDVHDLLAARAKEMGLSKKALLEAAVERRLADTRPRVVQQAESHLWQAIDLLAHQTACTHHPADDDVIAHARAIASICALALRELNRDPQRHEPSAPPPGYQPDLAARLTRWWLYPDEALSSDPDPNGAGTHAEP